MVKVKCTATDCNYETAEVGEELALELYKTHRTDVHPQPGGGGGNHVNRKAPAIDRPKITAGGTEENWSMFLQKWQIFKSGSTITNFEFNNNDSL